MYGLAVRKEAHLKDVEAESIRITKPRANGMQGGRFESLTPELKALLDDWNSRRTSRTLGPGTNEGRRSPKKHRTTPRVPLKDREFDTIVCPAHEAGFNETFLKERCWKV